MAEVVGERVWIKKVETTETTATVTYKIKNKTANWSWQSVTLSCYLKVGSSMTHVDDYELPTDKGTYTKTIVDAFTNLTPASTYEFRITAIITKGSQSTTHYSTYYEAQTNALTPDQPLLKICDGNMENPKWYDFTKYITVPSYDVNESNIEETWEDASYVTHKIVVRKKIKGSFQLHFTKREDYYLFIDLLGKNENNYLKGYTLLQLQVNNHMDSMVESDYSLRKTVFVTAYFFVTISSNPWNVPYYGTPKEYNDITVNVEEE